MKTPQASQFRRAIGSPSTSVGGLRGVIAIISLLLFSTFAFAQFKDLPADVQKNLGAIKKYPKASIILLWEKESFTLAADGSEVYELHSFRYLPDEASRDNWGDPHLAYDSNRQKIEVITARTYTADGRTIDCTPNNAYNPIVPDGLDLAPDYGSYRNLVVTMMGLENGSISELHYKLTTAKPLFPWIEGRIYFREEWPVMSHQVVVEIPSAATLNFKSDRGAPEPTVSGTTYTWSVGEQAGYDAADLGGHRVLLPNVAFSSAKDWSVIWNELKSRLTTALPDDVAVPASLSKMLEGATGNENKLDSIKSWATRFNQLGFEHPDFALTLRPVNEILATGYGNSLELAALVSKLATLNGIKCSVTPWFQPESPVPSLHEYHGTVLGITIVPGLEFYTDPLQSLTDFPAHNLQGAWLFPLGDAAQNPVQQAIRPKTPSFDLTLNLANLTDDTLRGHGTLVARGEWGAWENVRANGPSDYLAGLIPLKGIAITRSVVKELESPDHPSSVALDFEFTASALDTADGRRILPLDLLDFKTMTEGAPFSLPAREFRQEVSLPGEMTLHVECAVPENWKVEQSPRSGGRKWDFDEGKVSSEVKNGRFVYDRSLKLKKEWVPAESWPAFRAFILETSSSKNVVVFGR